MRNESTAHTAQSRDLFSELIDPSECTDKILDMLTSLVPDGCSEKDLNRVQSYILFRRDCKWPLLLTPDMVADTLSSHVHWIMPEASIDDSIIVVFNPRHIDASVSIGRYHQMASYLIQRMAACSTMRKLVFVLDLTAVTINKIKSFIGGQDGMMRGTKLWQQGCPMSFSKIYVMSPSYAVRGLLRFLLSWTLTEKMVSRLCFVDTQNVDDMEKFSATMVRRKDPLPRHYPALYCDAPGVSRWDRGQGAVERCKFSWYGPDASNGVRLVTTIAFLLSDTLRSRGFNMLGVNLQTMKHEHGSACEGDKTQNQGRAACIIPLKRVICSAFILCTPEDDDEPVAKRRTEVVMVNVESLRILLDGIE